MKERPILFSAPMVRAILDGTKTQTRRAVKLRNGQYMPPSEKADINGWRQMLRNCPYGKPGDRLWVREAWRTVAEADATPPRDLSEAHRLWFEVDVPHQAGAGKYRPPMFMPRWASRITLEITGVRVERLNDISEEDANAEGCERLHEDEHGYVFRDDRDWKLCPKCGGTRLHDALGGGGGVIHDVDCRECDTYQKRFKHLWQSINGPDSWAANPWVWVVEFKRLEQPT